MKTLKTTLLFSAALVLFGCGDDYNDYNPRKNGQTTTTVTTDSRQLKGPAEAKSNLEFPALSQASSSEVIVHYAVLNSKTNERGVNYSLEWDHTKKATRWVCYKMYSATNASNWSRSNWSNGDPWNYDPDVPQNEQQETYNELSKTNPPLANSSYYEKGHILASADRLGSQEANGQTYYMTNIYPMVHNFNVGAWATLEGRVRTWAKQSDTLYVCKGGTIDSNDKILGYTKGNHIVPKFFYMALLSKKGSTMKAIGFLLEHLDPTDWGPISGYARNIQQLERETGIDFFCNLPDDTENEIETVETSQLITDWKL